MCQNLSSFSREMAYGKTLHSSHFRIHHVPTSQVVLHNCYLPTSVKITNESDAIDKIELIIHTSINCCLRLHHLLQACTAQNCYIWISQIKESRCKRLANNDTQHKNKINYEFKWVSRLKIPSRADSRGEAKAKDFMGWQNFNF